MSDPTKAIFLSYAREDADAARRIAEALRSRGLEVWFDESELRGGDAWDAKIRKQINDCALFVPIISQHTDARNKGYFRLEWKLAVDQTHLLAEGVPFVAPVVIDDVREDAARVPAEFLRVHWTRLPGALPTPQFVEQIKRLLDSPQGGGGSEAVAKTVEPRGGSGGGRKEQGARRRLPMLVMAGAVAVIAIGLAVHFGVRPRKEAIAPISNPEPKTQNPKPTDGLVKADAKSIAVLPFENLSTEKDNASFADGMHDDVITALTKIHDLTVISRTSVMAYKTGGRNLKKIATELGVANILEGSVRRSGNQVRLNVQLIDARTDAHRWAHTYTEDLTDMFMVQSRLADAITTALKARFSPEEKTLIARRFTQNAEAYDQYLRTRTLEQHRSLALGREGYEEVVRGYERAVALDPDFLLPYVQLTHAHGLMYWFSHLDPTPERRALTEKAMETARRLAPTAPETRLAQGIFAYFCRNDWRQALQEYQAAEAELPNDAQLHFETGLALRRLGEIQDSLRRLERAVALNPNDVSVLSTHVEIVFALRRYAEARKVTERYLTLFPQDGRLLWFRARTQFELDGNRAAYLRAYAGVPVVANLLGRVVRDALLKEDYRSADRLLADPQLKLLPAPYANEPPVLLRSYIAWLEGRTADARRFADEALAELNARTSSPRQEVGVRMAMARAHAFAGRTEEAIREARESLAREIDVYAMAGRRNEFGRVLVICGRNEEAIALLRENMPVANSTPVQEVRHDPIWSRLKADPRFEEILKAVKPL